MYKTDLPVCVLKERDGHAATLKQEVADKTESRRLSQSRELELQLFRCLADVWLSSQCTVGPRDAPLTPLPQVSPRKEGRKIGRLVLPPTGHTGSEETCKASQAFVFSILPLVLNTLL